MCTKSIYTDGVTFSELWNASGSIRLLIFKWNLIKNNCKKLSRWTSHVPVNCFSLNSTACQLEAGQSMTDYQSVLVYLLMEKWRLKIEYLTVRDEITQNNHSNIRQNYSFFAPFPKHAKRHTKTHRCGNDLLLASHSISPHHLPCVQPEKFNTINLILNSQSILIQK